MEPISWERLDQLLQHGRPQGWGLYDADPTKGEIQEIAEELLAARAEIATLKAAKERL